MHMSPPELEARNRYSRSFQSKIFEPAPVQDRGFQPAGKRRDQTTSELFGSYDTREDLRPRPKTFRPKEDESSAWEKKQQFLSSHVLNECKHQSQQRFQEPTSEAGYVQPTRPVFDPYAEDEAVDTNVRRQEELKSKLFGRETPAVQQQQQQPGTNGVSRSRLTPNDFTWHSVPEARCDRRLHSGAQGRGQHSARGEMNHAERAYMEKCSNVFDRSSPQVRQAWEASQQEEAEAVRQDEERRRGNVYYSDLFGRSADFGEARRHRTQNSDSKMTVHQDWTNAKTELLHTRESRAEAPHQRKSEELHRARIFGEEEGAVQAYQAPERLEAVTHDNSEKVRAAQGRGTMNIHQAHLKTSIAPSSFYEEAESARHWQVAELHLSGLGRDANDDYVRHLCQGTEVQLVKVAAEVDPVRNLCKGRAKVTVRFNPQRDSIDGLVRKIEECNLRVEM